MTYYDEEESWRQDRDSGFHRMLVEYLIETKHLELAAAALKGAIRIYGSNHPERPDRLFVEIPLEAYRLVLSNTDNQSAIRRAVSAVTAGHLHMQPQIEFRMKKLDAPDERWESQIKTMITQSKGSNQSLVSDLLSIREGRPLHVWNELRYASKSEIRVAQEFEKRKVMFFPLAVAVRADTGENWIDHREVDFLVCDNGKFGILEVAYHPGRYEKDSEKNHWFKHSGILCIENFTAERCYNEAEAVVTEFLAILRKH